MSRGRRRSCRLGMLVLALAGPLAAPPAAATAQGYRGWTSTNLQLVELKPIGLAKEQTFAATQDLALTAWGLGIEGLSVTGLVRARARAGGDVLWPRSDDEFDALLGYAQLQRGPLRVRAGRQEVRSGLGFAAFDGGSVAYTLGAWRGEAYGGRSLARALREPATDELRGLDDFFEDRSVILLGGSVAGRFRGASGTVRYHREILSDRSSLVGERASVDVAATLPRVRLRGSLDYDFSFQQIGKSLLTASVPLRDGRWLIEVSGQRYVPYFDLSTLWGFFEPVSYHEVVGRLGWSPGAELGLWVSGGWRTYSETDTEIILEPMRDTGWRADAGARWWAAPDLLVAGTYELEWGPGGFLNSGDVSVRYSVTERLAASLGGLTFQKIEEYRLGEGRAVGGRVAVDFDWNDRATVSAGGSIIRHRDGGNIYTSPWNQGRAWMSLRFDIGEDPGLANRGGTRR